jgi:hypothetical protein
MLVAYNVSALLEFDATASASTSKNRIRTPPSLPNWHNLNAPGLRETEWDLALADYQFGAIATRELALSAKMAFSQAWRQSHLPCCCR